MAVDISSLIPVVYHAQYIALAVRGYIKSFFQPFRILLFPIFYVYFIDPPAGECCDNFVGEDSILAYTVCFVIVQFLYALLPCLFIAHLFSVLIGWEGNHFVVLVHQAFVCVFYFYCPIVVPVSGAHI